MSAIKKPRVPSYRLRKPSGQAVVRLGGKDFYLGEHGSQASQAEYRRLISEWLAGQPRRHQPQEQVPEAAGRSTPPATRLSRRRRSCVASGCRPGAARRTSCGGRTTRSGVTGWARKAGRS